MAEDLIREIHTQLDLITSGLAALRGFAEPPTSSRCIFSKRSTARHTQ